MLYKQLFFIDHNGVLSTVEMEKILSIPQRDFILTEAETIQNGHKWYTQQRNTF